MGGFRANTEKVVWRVVDGEAVLVHADTSAYYGLNAAATSIWEALVSAPLTRDDLVRRLGARYDVRVEALAADVDAFLSVVRDESLVIEAASSNGDHASQTHGDHASQTPAAADVRPANGRYEPPGLTRFGELEKLVLSGE